MTAKRRQSQEDSYAAAYGPKTGPNRRKQVFTRGWFQPQKKKKEKKETNCLMFVDLVEKCSERLLEVVG